MWWTLTMWGLLHTHTPLPPPSRARACALLARYPSWTDFTLMTHSLCRAVLCVKVSAMAPADNCGCIF